MKRFIKALGLFLLVIFLFRGWVYRATVSYVPVGERPHIALQDEDLIALLQTQRIKEPLSLKEIARIANKMTCRKLQFIGQSASANPNGILKTGKANCMGYAALCNAIAQYLIEANQSSQKFETKHLVGKMYFLGFDLHQFFSDPFFRDHDYNQIRNLETGEMIWLDPSVSDYSGIQLIVSTPY